MKVIIAGSRSVTPSEFASAMSKSKLIVLADEIVTGKAPGVDTFGELYGLFFGIPIKEFPADWENTNVPDAFVKKRKDGSKYNVKAGFMRNTEMARYADALVLIWKNKSNGSKDMLDKAKEFGLKIEVIEV